MCCAPGSRFGCSQSVHQLSWRCLGVVVFFCQWARWLGLCRISDSFISNFTRLLLSLSPFSLSFRWLQGCVCVSCWQSCVRAVLGSPSPPSSSGRASAPSLLPLKVRVANKPARPSFHPRSKFLISSAACASLSVSSSSPPGWHPHLGRFPHPTQALCPPAESPSSGWGRCRLPSQPQRAPGKTHLLQERCVWGCVCFCVSALSIRMGFGVTP